ncbi:MAG: DUF1990 family protein [Chloroflexi bacterium]|nr:DUF1990 family protein [Chloroflexota bacterium]
MKYLDVWNEQPLSYTPGQANGPGWHTDHYETILAYNCAAHTFQKAADLLLRYQFYPKIILSHLGDFDLENSRQMRVGDRIVQRIHVLQLFGRAILDVIGLNEVSQIISEPRRKGFTYVTVAPHVEQGEWAAQIHWRDNNDLVLTVDAVSRPAPQEPGRNHSFMRRFQKKAHQAGITHFQKLLLA